MKCKVVRQCWRELQLEFFRLRLVQTRSAEEFVMNVLSLRRDICLRIVILLWRWCDVRNKTNAGELMSTCQDMMRSVTTIRNDIQREDTGESRMYQAQRKW
jgi:hypothetical protein